MQEKSDFYFLLYILKNHKFFAFFIAFDYNIISFIILIVTMVEHNLEMDKFNEKVNGIQEDLRKIKELVLSETERKKRIEDIKRRAESAKIELEKSINTLKDEAKKEAQALVESLNEIINLKLSI